MDNDKIKKQKKDKPYVLIFFVLAALYLIWALISGVALKGRASEIDHVVDCYIANSNVLFFTDPEPVVSSRYDAAAASDDLESFYNSAFLRLEYPDSLESQEIYATRLREALQVLYAQYPDGNIIIALHDYYATAAVFQLVYNTCEQVGLLINVGSYITNYADWNLLYINCFYETVTAWTRDLSNPTSTPTPTPTAAPQVTEYLLLHGYSSQYLLIDFEGSGIGSGSVTVPYSSALQSLQSEYNSTSDQAVFSPFWSSGTTYTECYFYCNFSSISSVKVYFLTAAPVDLDYVRANIEPIVLLIQDSTGSSLSSYELNSYYNYVCATSSTVCPNTLALCFRFRYNESSFTSWSVSQCSSAFASSLNLAPEQDLSYFSPFSSNTYSYSLRYRIDFVQQENPFVTPSPSPQPTPTDLPQVIIHLPSGTPTPTAPVSFGPGDLPGSGGSAGGSIGSGLSGSELNTILSFFKARLQNNQAIAFIAESFNVLPAELLWYFGFAIVIGICVRILWIFIFAKEG